MLIPRRTFVRRSMQLAGGLALAGPFQALLARQAAGQAARAAGYGPLAPVADETTGLPLLALPRGFRYLSFGWTGDAMSDGVATPPMHDGMAIAAAGYGRVTLVRNHEVDNDGAPFAAAEATYDPHAAGGTTNLVFNTRRGALERSWASLSGTVRNCAGGPTPWRSWLTCEESVLGPGDTGSNDPSAPPLALEKTHGWIFDVPADGGAAPVPIEDMGRFVHEAVAVDPRTGIVYETEDKTECGFFRFVPHQPRLVHLGGKLQALRVPGKASVAKNAIVGAELPVEWIDVGDPTLAHSPGTTDGQGVFQQVRVQGATVFARLEGCTYNSGLVYLVSTSGGEISAGQIWEYNPHREKLRLVYESADKETLNMPDNIAVSPRGGLVLCEDSDRDGMLIHGLTLAGELFPLVRNEVVLSGERNGISGDFRGQEFAGAVYSPDGRWLFVNIQTPGITLAITGPWESGPL